MTAAYDSYDYPKYWQDRSYEHNAEVVALNHFFSVIKKKENLVDIGCGHGRLCQEYMDVFKKITLVDPSKKLLKVAQKECTGEGKLSFVQSTVEEIHNKITSNNYDVALLVRVLHHIDNPDTAFLQVSKLLKDKGYFIVEFANKVHGKALIRQFIKGNFTFLLDIFPNDRRSKKNIKDSTISFVNHHPDKIEDSLAKNGFKIVERLSVSNVRNSFLKNHIPMKTLLVIEKFFQGMFAKINFGPSIFILAQKKPA